MRSRPLTDRDSNVQDLDLLGSRAQQASYSSMSPQEHGSSWLADAVDSSECCERSSAQRQPRLHHSQQDSSSSMTNEICQHTEGLHQRVKQPYRREFYIHCHSSRARCQSFLAVILCSLLLAPATQAARNIEAPTLDPQVCAHVTSHAMP